jgi:hypothetical protein
MEDAAAMLKGPTWLWTLLPARTQTNVKSSPRTQRGKTHNAQPPGSQARPGVAAHACDPSYAVKHK